MDFLIAEAAAQNGAPPPTAGFEFLIMIGIFFLIMYFLIIRPQSKRAKEHKRLLESLNRGDEIVTSGGMAGRITEVGDTFLDVEIADGVSVKVQKQAVTTVMPKGSLKDGAKPKEISRPKKGAS